ncbi:MAG: helix-turn-helix transcriptional regulator [Magnetococcales bacterium]|nr:helix-turn-helix transcriptional regulator [Magnetococcales bacterium]
MDQYNSINGLLSGMDKLIISIGFECWVYSIKMLHEFPEKTIDEVFHNCNQYFMNDSDEIYTSGIQQSYHGQTPDKTLANNPIFHESKKNLWKHFRPMARIILEEKNDISFIEFGYSLTTPGKFGEKGILLLRNINRKIAGINDMTSNIQAVNVIFPFMHLKYIKLKGWNPPGSFLELTERELECLRWAAAGKTSLETGVIMNITERTVKFHLVNAQKKLMSKNKTQAVARAILYNYL